MSTEKPHVPDPKRVEIGRRNQLKWKGFTPEGLERVRQAALKRKAWEKSTGPRTPEGKARVALNGKKYQKGNVSLRELKAEIAALDGVIDLMAECRQLAARTAGNDEQQDGLNLATSLQGG